MSTQSDVQTANRQLANQIHEEAHRDSNSPYAGKFVGIANGRVVVAADNWREVSERLRQVEPDPSKCYCIEPSADYESVHEVWRVYYGVS